MRKQLCLRVVELTSVIFRSVFFSALIFVFLDAVFLVLCSPCYLALFLSEEFNA